VITGATSGIGGATARRFVAEGACVVLASRTERRGDELAAELGDQATYVRTDVAHEHDIAAMIDNRRKQAKLERNLARATPTPRAGLASDVAAAAVYLVSDEASFI
jgi:NAD(P)-dependent dehydrogenase (short-subunit alcohol dehydrogenase family)